MGKESGLRLVGGWSSSLLGRRWMVQEDLAGGTLAAARFLSWSSGGQK